jgi:ribonuclease HI
MVTTQIPAVVVVEARSMSRECCDTSAALFLDFQGAFDNVSSDRLLHTLHHLGCLKPIISWSASFLTSRSTALFFDGWIDQ